MQNKKVDKIKVTVKAAGLDERIIKLFGEVIRTDPSGEIVFSYDEDLNILIQMLSQYPLEVLLIEKFKCLTRLQ